MVAMADIFEDQLEKNLKVAEEDKRNALIAHGLKVTPEPGSSGSMPSEKCWRAISIS